MINQNSNNIDFGDQWTFGYFNTRFSSPKALDFINLIVSD